MKVEMFVNIVGFNDLFQFMCLGVKNHSIKLICTIGSMYCFYLPLSVLG